MADNMGSISGLNSGQQALASMSSQTSKKAKLPALPVIQNNNIVGHLKAYIGLSMFFKTNPANTP